MDTALEGLPARALSVGAAVSAWPADVAAAWRQGAATRAATHRADGLPTGAWVMGQSWEDLLFAHWPLPTDVLRSVVPRELGLDTFDDSAWLGITPFRLTGLRLRGTLPPPGLARFPELNMRTYVLAGGHPGIWFLSLDAGSALAVAGARRLYRLPYFRARMSIRREQGWIEYSSRRTGDGVAELLVDYRPCGAPFQAVAGSLEHWLTERYRLYTVVEPGRVDVAEIHHAPWSLQPAEAVFRRNSMTAPYGIELPNRDPLLHFAARQDVVVWPRRRLTGPRR